MKKYIKFRLVDGYISSDESNESENIDGFFFVFGPMLAAFRNNHITIHIICGTQ